MIPLNLGVYEAVTTCNDGHSDKWVLFKEIRLRPGKRFTNMMKPLNQRWIGEAEKAPQELEKKMRKHKHMLKRSLKDNCEEG